MGHPPVLKQGLANIPRNAIEKKKEGVGQKLVSEWFKHKMIVIRVNFNRKTHVDDSKQLNFPWELYYNQFEK